MSWDSWDEDGTPHPLALRRTGRSEQEPDRLPEVRELEVLGWEPAPEDMLWVFLPYVWPPAARTWIPDRSTHWAVETRLDGHGHITAVEAAPLAERDLHDLDWEAEEVLTELGLPHRPPGRLWLLRPPGSLPTVGAVLDHLRAVAEERGVEVRASAEFLALTRAELAALAAGSGSGT
ncbi:MULTISPECIES: DUF5956 family protein [unclassified Streptomyces]|uniref:DUF5956 family protein n=1 Tax=Streptomyces sp. R33 TaxID=3238629 RepID=A0AB39Y451_9ACTN|nr:DUF5956 family protein [Streptomyces sp. XY332]